MERYKVLSTTVYKLKIMSEFETKIYSKYVQKMHSSGKSTKIFHGTNSLDVEQEALLSLGYVLALCSVIIAMATMTLVWEIVFRYLVKKYNC